MARDRELSRSPSYKRRRYSRSPSPVGHRYSSRRYRGRRDRSSRSPYSYSRWSSQFVLSNIRDGEAAQYLHAATRKVVHQLLDDARVAHQRQGVISDKKSRTTSLSPIAKSPSIGPIERKIVSEKTKIEDEEQKKRRQHEAECKLLEEETAKRVEEAIRKRVQERLNSDDIKLEIQKCLEEGRKKVLSDVSAQLEKEKEAAVIETRRKEEQARKEKEELERLVEENRRRVEEAQTREAMEQQRREEERYRELEELQRQKEEALRRKKQQEEEERAKQQKLLGKNKSRPKLSFAIGSK